MLFMLLAVIVSISLVLLTRSLHGASQKLPPGPCAWQLIRNLSLFVKRPHIAFANMSKIYGPLISFRVGNQLIVVTSSPSTAKEILSNRLFTGRFLPSVFYNIPGTRHASVILSEECDRVWKSIRLIEKTRVFCPKAVESNVVMRSNKVAEMLTYLRTKGGQIVNIDDLVLQTLVNVVSNTLTSRNLPGFDIMGQVDNKFKKFLHKVSKQVSTVGLADIYPVFKYVDFWTKKESMDLLKNMRLIWANTIEERRILHLKSHHNPISQDLLDVLLLENRYSDNQIGFLLTELLIASSESTASVAIWLFIELLKKDEIMRQVRNEIATQAIEGYSINESRLAECQYFNACIKETLRVHVPGPFGIPRRAIKTCKVDNYVVPKDSIILVNFWGIHLDPESWENATSFIPERFLNKKANIRGTEYEFLPFSSGQRMCPGFNVAVKNIQVMVASLVYFCDWSLPDNVLASDLGARVKYRKLIFKRQDPLFLISKVRV